MPSDVLDSQFYLRKTRIAYTATRLLNTPFWALHLLLAFIMRKDLDASSLQIACVIGINPVVSLFSFFWSARIQKRRDRLVSNIVWSGILGHLPFLFVPFVTDPWFFVAASGIYMLFYRGVNPAWMEVLKINVPEESRKNVFAYGSAVYHVGGALLAIVIGWALDDYVDARRWLFPLTACIALCAVFFQITLPIIKRPDDSDAEIPPFSFAEQFQKPLKNALNLIKCRPDFARFQIGFMLGGGGLMLWKPALPEFFFDVLDLNFKELTIAMTLCKSIGYTLTLPLWTRAMSRMNLFAFSGSVTAVAALFPVGLMAAQWNLLWLYGAYLLYGIMQAGSELSWNLSGPIFSREEDSSIYTGVNVLAGGLRGCAAPAAGYILCTLTNPSTVLIAGGGLCLLGTWQMCMREKRNAKNASAAEFIPKCIEYPDPGL